jgi:hypothetical protein
MTELRMRWARNIACMRRRNAYKVFVGKPKGDH